MQSVLEVDHYYKKNTLPHLGLKLNYQPNKQHNAYTRRASRCEFLLRFLHPNKPYHLEVRWVYTHRTSKQPFIYNLSECCAKYSATP
jgi:hypothetical protein